MPRFRIVALVATLAAVAAGVIVVVWWLGSIGSSAEPTTTASATASPSAEATPSTSSSASATPSAVATASTEVPSASVSAKPTPDARGSVSPFITNAIYDAAAGTVTVYAFVPGISEDSGTCTANFTDGSSTTSGQSAASFDVSTTTCAPVTLKVASAPSATAGVTVTFDSPSSVGTSTPAKVTK